MHSGLHRLDPVVKRGAGQVIYRSICLICLPVSDCQMPNSNLIQLSHPLQSQETKQIQRPALRPSLRHAEHRTLLRRAKGYDQRQ